MSKKRAWFSDDASSDLATGLGRSAFLHRMWEVIRETSTVQSSTVFGLVGQWGAGKTSILQWLHSQTHDDDSAGWQLVWFNPWDFQDAESLQLGFFKELSAAFPTGKAEVVRKRLSKFGRSVAPFASLSMLGGPDLSKQVAALASVVEGDGGVASARRKLEKTLRRQAQPILVVIDDLDRVSAEELLLTLKLVRQVGRLPFVHYILSYDESTVLDVLTRTSLVGKQSRARARDYMEKVVQVRFDIPRLRPSDALKLTNASLAEIAEVTGFTLTDDDTSRYSTAYFSFLGARLDTPRALKRYFAQVRLLSPSLMGEVDFVDFLVLTWLRTAEPGAYALLQQRRERLLGADRSGLIADSGKPDLEARAKEWRDLLRSTGTRQRDAEGVAQAIGFLFPRFASEWAGRVPPRDSASALTIANESYFDRYFSFGLTEDDIADVTVRAAVEGLSSDEQEASNAVASLGLAIASNPQLAVDKLAKAVEELAPTEPAVFAWMARVYATLPESNEFVPPARRLERALAVRLRAMTDAERASTVAALITSEGLRLLLTAHDLVLRMSSEGASPVPVLSEAEATSITTVLNAELADRNPVDLPPDLRRMAWSWFRVDDRGFAEWISKSREQFGDLDVLAMFVGGAHSLGTGTRQHWLQNLDVRGAAEYFDLDELRSEYADAITGAEVPIADSFHDPLDTPQNRRLVALAGLRADSEPEE